MDIGYVRVSTADQNADLQTRALQDAGCKTIFEDRASGAFTKRQGLSDALATAKEGDTLTVWRLDRLGRSLSHLIETITVLGERGVGFRSLTENIDTTSSGGRLVFHMMGALAEFERTLIQDRTKAGLEAARKRGVQLGRPIALSPAKLLHASQLIDAGENPSAVALSLGVGRSTLYRALAKLPKQ